MPPLSTSDRIDLHVADYVAAHVEEWHGLVQALIRERSVFEEEHGVVRLVAERIAAIGLEPVRVAHDPARLSDLPEATRPFSHVADRCSLVARIPGRSGGRSLALNAHLDVVPEGERRRWTRPPFGGEIDVDRRIVYGRGAMDDKAGVAVALAVMETLVHAPVPLDGDVVFHFVLEDETTGNGSLLCLAAGHRADGVLIIDGTRPDRAIDSHAGQLHFDVHVTGKPASVSVSHLGVNAAELLGRLLARLVDRVAALNAERIGAWTRFPSPFQLVPHRLAAAGDPLTVPDDAQGSAYVTFPPPWTLAAMRHFLEQETRLFAEERGLEPVPVLSYRGLAAEPVVSESASLGAILNSCAATVGFGPVEIGPSTGTSDLRHFVALGIPGLLYGPGRGFNPHRPDEHYHLDDFGPMVRLFTSFAMNWCGSHAAPT